MAFSRRPLQQLAAFRAGRGVRTGQLNLRARRPAIRNDRVVGNQGRVIVLKAAGFHCEPSENLRAQNRYVVHARCVSRQRTTGNNRNWCKGNRCPIRNRALVGAARTRRGPLECGAFAMCTIPCVRSDGRDPVRMMQGWADYLDHLKQVKPFRWDQNGHCVTSTG
jgi:hypothetical protein